MPSSEKRGKKWKVEYSLELKVKWDFQTHKNDNKIGGKQPKRVDIDAWSYLSMHSLRGLLN